MSNSKHNPRILIAGCGYTGERCADFFYAVGWDVVGLVFSEESASRLARKSYPVLAVNIADKTQLAAVKERMGSPDALVHCLSGHGARDAAAYRMTYVETLGNLLDVFPSMFPVFTSSTSVYPQNDGSVVAEDSLVGGSPTAEVLLEAEKMALDADGGVVRLGGIYGPGRCRFIDAVMGGQALPGEPSALINFIHRDDAARALQHVAMHRLSGVFNAVDNVPIRRDALAAVLLATPFAPSALPTGKHVQNIKLRSTDWHPAWDSIVDFAAKAEKQEGKS